MDEVKTMSRAGESVGKAVGTGVRGARHGALRASKAGAEVTRQAVALAEQELASRGVATDELQERIAQRATGMSRKELNKRGKKALKEWDKRTAKSRKQLAKNTKAARKELAGRIDPAPSKGRRKWPWVLLVLLAGLGAAAAAALSRRPEELPIADAQERFSAQEPDTPGSANGDGQAAGRHSSQSHNG